MDDRTIGLIALAVAALTIVSLDLAVINDRVNRRINEPRTLRALALRVGRLASATPMMIGVGIGSMVFGNTSWMDNALYGFFLVGIMIMMCLVHGLAVRRFMFPSWFALVYIVIGVLFGSIHWPK